MFIEQIIRDSMLGGSSLVSDRIAAWEQEHQIPVRILAPRVHATADRSWVDDHVANTGFTVADGTERGITIWSVGNSNSEGIRNLGGYRPNNNNMDYLQVHVPRHQPQGTGLLEVEWDTPYDISSRPVWWDQECPAGKILFGEIAVRTLYDWIGFCRYESLHWFDDMFGALYIEALNSCSSDDFAAAIAEAVARRTQEALATYERAHREQRLTQLRNQIVDCEEEIVSYTSGLACQMRQARQLGELLQAAEAVNASGNTARFTSDFEALQNHPRVQSIEFAGTTVHILTSDDFRITRPDTGDSRWLGQFDIKINFETAEVHIQNLTTPRGDRQHPHVAGTSPCWGDHHEDFVTVIQRGELLLFWELLIQYLETLNLRDCWGAFGAYWFDMPDERPLETAEIQES